MKAISVKQPWANLIAFGKKTIETRTWNTKYRGPLLIVSSKKPNEWPAGYAVAIVDVVGCREMTKEDEEAACCPVYPRAKSWLLDNIRPIAPIPMNGALSIFEVPYKQEDFEVLTVEKMLSDIEIMGRTWGKLTLNYLYVDYMRKIITSKNESVMNAACKF